MLLLAHSRFNPMKSQYYMKKIAPIFIFLILALFILIFWFNFKKDFKSINQNNQVSTNFSIETPNLHDKNLAQFYLWTKEDPLFASPDFNPTEFQNVINVLLDEENKLLNFSKIKDRLYPDKFLKDIVEVNINNQSFLKDPTSSSAAALINAYKKTVLDYEISRKLLLDKISSYNPKSPYDTFPTLNITTSLSIIKNDLSTLGENTNSLNKEINARETCLKEGVGCVRPANNFSNLKLVASTSNFSAKDVLDKDILALPDLKGDWYGPYIVSTPCLGWDKNLQPEQKLYYVVKGKEGRDFSPNEQDLPSLQAKLATDNFYHKINMKIESSEKNLFAGNNKDNIIRQAEGNIYLCSDISYIPTLSSVDKLYSKYKNKPIFNNLKGLKGLSSEVSDILKEGDVLENSFFKAEFPSENDAVNLVNYYAYLYYKSIIWVNDPNYKSTEWAKMIFKNRDEYLNRYLEYTRKLSNINEVLAHAVGNFSSLRVKYEMFAIDRNEYYIFANRNMYGMVYFPFSPSFYRLPNDLEYLKKVNVPSNGRYFNYPDAVQKYSREEIVSWNVDELKILKERFAKFLIDNPQFKN